jgi:hypothetical protein
MSFPAKVTCLAVFPPRGTGDLPISDDEVIDVRPGAVPHDLVFAFDGI